MEKTGFITHSPTHFIDSSYGTFEPLFEFILFAVSLATLTFPVFFIPVRRVTGKFLHKFQEQRLSEVMPFAQLSFFLFFYLAR